MPHGGVCHFEVPADNAERARKFYGTVFGWHLTHMPEMNYTMVTTGPVDKDGHPTVPGYVGGGIGAREGPLKAPVFTVEVTDIDAALTAVGKHGGSTVQGKTPIGPMGFVAYFKDSEGNVVGMFQPPAH